MEHKSERHMREILVPLDDNDNMRIEEENAKFLRKVFASAHINVLLGSGFSGSVVPVLQGRESWFQAVDEHMRDCPGNERGNVALGTGALAGGVFQIHYAPPSRGACH